MDNAGRKRRLSGEVEHEEESARRVRPYLVNSAVEDSAPHLIQRMDSPPPSPPVSPCGSQAEDSDAEQSDDDGLLAGFEFCSKEAIRYLLEEEKLSPDHPVVRNLQLHLTRAAAESSTVAPEPPEDN